MKILAFETSCDDTSIALFEHDRLLAMKTKSQIEIHAPTGGVVPEVASREHANVIYEVLSDVLSETELTLDNIDYIAVTSHPGLVPSLLTGITVANSLSALKKIPIIPIYHIKAHVFANYLEREKADIVYPLVCLTVSGGHNEIYHMKDMWDFEKIGATQDDAAGEAYDKVAKLMGLGYPGGPIISKNAGEYSGVGTKLFPRVFLEKSEFGFSFSGLKSAVRREVEKRGELGEDDIRELSYEFQAAANEVLAFKIVNAAKTRCVKTVLLAGGVSANDDLRERIQTLCDAEGLNFLCPLKKVYCMDNAAMIGILAYYMIVDGKTKGRYGDVSVGEI